MIVGSRSKIVALCLFPLMCVATVSHPGFSLRLSLLSFVAAVDAAAAVGVAAVEETETVPMVCAWRFVKPFLCFRFQSSAYRPNVGFLNVPPSKQRATCPRRNPTHPDREHCLFSPASLFLRCAVCVVQHPLFLNGPVQMLVGFVHGLFGISCAGP